MIFKSYEILKSSSNFSKYNIFLFYGENNGLKKDIRKSIINVKNMTKDNAEFLSFYENEIIDNEDNFYNSIYSGSLFNTQKFITINEASDKIIKQIEDVSDKIPDNICLIIFSQILEKKSKLRNFIEKNTKTICVPCYLDSEKDLEIVLQNELRKNNIIISRESINLLISQSNNDRNNLRNEIEKIISYSSNKKNMTIDEIKSITNFSGEYKSDILINECLSGNIIQYKKVLSELYINTVNYIFLLRILNNKIQKLLNMKKMQKNYNDLDSLLNTSKPPIFWKDKPTVKKQLKIWSLDDLKKIINEANNIEVLCKKNPNLSKVIFFNFFTSLCKKASNYS